MSALSRLTGSLQSRLLLGASAWGLLALVVAGVLLFYLFRQHLEEQVRQRLADDLAQLLARTEADAAGGLVQRQTLSDPLYQRVLSGHYWQIERGKEALLRSRSLWDQSLTLPAGAGGGYRHLTGPRGQPLLVLVRQVTLPRVPGNLRVTVATDLAAVAAALRRFALVLAIGLGALFLGLVLAAVLQVRLGLRPLRRMRRGLAAIRAGEAERLTEHYPVEVAPLAADFNAVLVDNARLIERARGQAGNLAHALKTPLSVLINEADALRARGEAALAERLLHEADIMRRQIDWHLAHARIAAVRRPGARVPLRPAVERLARTLGRLFPQMRIAVRVPETLDFRGEAQDLEQMVGNLMENACKWAGERISVEAAGHAGGLMVTIHDDGPGLSLADRERVLQRGRRLDESVPGDGLGLAIVGELADLYGGTLTLASSEQGGLAATLTLPGVEAGRPP